MNAKQLRKLQWKNRLEHASIVCECGAWWTGVEGAVVGHEEHEWEWV